MDPAHIKNELFQKSIRRQQLDSLFQQRRQDIGTLGNQKQIDSKNKQRLQELIKTNNLRQIYQSMKEFNLELVPAILSVSKSLFNLVIDAFDNTQALSILSLLILHCYDQVKIQLKNHSVYNKVITAIYAYIQQKDEIRLKILLTILKNMATRCNEEVKHKQFAQIHFAKLYESFYNKPNFLIFLAYVSQQQKLPFQPLFSNICPLAIDPDQNIVVRISTIVIIMNQITNCSYQQLQASQSSIFSLLKNTYKEKTKFTVSLRHNCLQKIGELIEKIPEQQLQKSSFLKDWQTLLFPFLSLLKQIEPLAVKKIIYQIAGVVINKMVNQKHQIFQKIINNQMIGLIISGLDYTDSEIIRRSLKNLLILIRVTTHQAKIREQLISYSIDVQLQSLVYNMDQFISSMAQQLLDDLNSDGKPSQSIMEIEQ